MPLACSHDPSYAIHNLSVSIVYIISFHKAMDLFTVGTNANDGTLLLRGYPSGELEPSSPRPETSIKPKCDKGRMPDLQS
jgi:hypothetical protein